MSSAVDFLAGTKILEEVESPVNGKIQVVKSLGFGTYIQVEKLTQSGGVVRDVWRTTLKKVKGQKSKVKSCLILGLGGGSAAELVRKYWPETKITGIEIDPIMVDLGKKYLDLGGSEVRIVIEDAYNFCSNQALISNRYDLILVDLYVGDKVPKKFETDEFIKLVKSLLSKEGIAVFNRLYWDEKRKEAEIFHKKLIHVFRKVRPVYPEANVMFVCSF